LNLLLEEQSMSTRTETVLLRHLQAATIGVDAVMADYIDSSVITTADGTDRGLAQIREYFTGLLEGATRGFTSSFRMIRQDSVGDVAFIAWDAAPWFRHATDTFVLGDDSILLQAIAAPPGS
jgi:hypothetical protein